MFAQLQPLDTVEETHRLSEFLFLKTRFDHRSDMKTHPHCLVSGFFFLFKRAAYEIYKVGY